MDKIEEIKKRVLHPEATTLSIRRVRKIDVCDFKCIADNEFLGDYGMAFKELMDSYRLVKDVKEQMIQSGINKRVSQ